MTSTRPPGGSPTVASPTVASPTAASPMAATASAATAAVAGDLPGGRAVILVGNPAAPYSRAVRLARTLSRVGYAVEIAAVAAPGLPDRQTFETWEIRRYGPSGRWARFGRSVPSAGASPAAAGRSGGWRSLVGWPVRIVTRTIAALRRWIFWPHTVRGWWATLERDLSPADLYHAAGSLTVAAALHARAAHPVGPNGLPARVIYDAIDDVMESNNVLDMPVPLRAHHEGRETAWAQAADGLITVSEPLAERLGVRWGRSLAVVANFPEIKPRSDDLDGAGGAQSARIGPLRRELGLDADTRIVLFQGRLGPRLGLDEAADAVLAVPGAIFVVLGFGRGFERARARDAEPPWAGRHFTIAARDPDDLLAWTADADVAVIPLPPVSLNQRLSSPNKFWEAIAAGTPVVVPDSLTYMADLVRAEDIGVVARSASATDLAAGIREALARLEVEPAWRVSIRAIAAERYAWPIAEAAYLDVLRHVTATDAGTDGR